MSKTYPVIRFSQYGSDSPSDDLVMFAASAKDIYAWAGIPRKGWNIRMLFQRPITVSRETELKRFWREHRIPRQIRTISSGQLRSLSRYKTKKSLKAKMAS